MSRPAEQSKQTALVMLVDDDASLRRALSRQIQLLGYAVQSFGTPEDLLQAAETETADCLVLDLMMPGMSGLELQQELLRRGWSMPTVFLSAQGDIPSTVQAMQDGALDFLEKPVEAEILEQAISRAVAKSREISENRATRQAARTRFASLTDRQRDVFAGVVAGNPNKVIAHDLGITIRTVKAHRQIVMKKMSATSVADLVLLSRDLTDDSQTAT